MIVSKIIFGIALLLEVLIFIFGHPQEKDEVSEFLAWQTVPLFLLLAAVVARHIF